MKLNFTKIKEIRQLGTVALSTGIACLLAVSISSCNKSSSTAGSATLAVVAAAPDAPSADFYINGSLVNGTPLVYGSYISYFSAVSGTSKVGFDDTGTTTAIALDTINLAASKTYTLFLCNLVAKREFVLVKDTIVSPPTNKASIRLANMSPDAPNVDLVIGGKVIVSNASYKQVSSFVAIPVVDNDTLRIVQTGTSNLLGVVNALTVESGAVYTIWLNGFASGINGYVLQANIMRNAAL
ncbi:DUF4397 domain-containing protein [Mucilaginibacter sp. L196]|uniref:DUF4397 domain-containing protein n=1 Tax=Mucilaginibacter sp. L196 TaxID=1641870 RepID=UPI00131C9357|nr:DUF4397 domain-containing protein [Mucilaginibacter sp. L196]